MAKGILTMMTQMHHMRQALFRLIPSFIRQKLVNPEAQKLAGNTGWLFADKILRAVGELTVGIWLARYLGPEQFGTLSFAIAFVALFTPLYTLGLEKIVVRDIVQHPEQAHETLGSALGLRVVAGVLGALVATSLIMLLRPGQPMLQGLVGLMAFGLVFQASDVVTFWFQSQIQAKYDVQARSSAYGVTSLARIGCILTQASLATIGITYILEPLLRAVGIGVVYRRTEKTTKKWQFSFKRSKALLWNSWPLILSGVAIMVYLRIDQVMLGELADDKAVGLYSAVVKLSEGWYFIPAVIASSVFPSILSVKKRGEDQYHLQLSKLFKLVVVISYLVSILTSLSSGTLILLLLGGEYTNAEMVLSIHVWSLIFVSVGMIRDLWMTAENLIMILFQTKVLGAILNIVMNFFLIPIYGIEGAAIATLVSYMTANFLTCFLYGETQRMGRIVFKSILLQN